MNHVRNAAPARHGGVVFTIGCALAALLSGCATGQDYEIGQRAERNQEPHVAYDAYCRAAVQNPDNASIKNAIKRVTPKAADYWEKQGHMKVGQRQYADAWRDFMHVLEIRPDHPSAALVIRQLEQEHPTEVVYAKQEYEQRGARSLVASGQAAGQTQVAQAGNQEARGRTADLGTEDDVYVAPSRVRNTPPPPPPTYGQYGAQPGTGSVSPATMAPAQSSAAAPIPYNPPPSRYAQPQTPNPPTAPMAVAAPVTAEAGPPSGFMVVRTLSKKDRRYARRREFVDGVAIRVDDVDDNDADLELFMGGVQVAEIKNIHINESVRFVGQTGRRFRLIVLDIRESSETVRIGVTPTE